jgi:hypothetical protein
MKNAKGTKNVSKKNTSKNSGKKSNGHKKDCGCPICKNMKKKKGGSGEPTEELVKEDVARDDEYDGVEEIDKPIPVKEEITAKEIVMSSGGTRKRRSKGKRSNGHKPTCCCPICKNTRKGKRTRKNISK